MAHGNPVLDVRENETVDFINAMGGSVLLIHAEKSYGEKQYCILDCMGNETASGKIDLTAGVHDFKVPECGMLQLF